MAFKTTQICDALGCGATIELDPDLDFNDEASVLHFAAEPRSGSLSFGPHSFDLCRACALKAGTAAGIDLDARARAIVQVHRDEPPSTLCCSTVTSFIGQAEHSGARAAYRAGLAGVPTRRSRTGIGPALSSIPPMAPPSAPLRFGEGGPMQRPNLSETRALTPEEVAEAHRPLTDEEMGEKLVAASLVAGIPMMACGCPEGAHPPHRNMLEGAAERVCKLGWAF